MNITKELFEKKELLGKSAIIHTRFRYGTDRYDTVQDTSHIAGISILITHKRGYCAILDGKISSIFKIIDRFDDTFVK
jgi:hypothetical protein